MNEARRALTKTFLFGSGITENVFLAEFGADIRGDSSVLQQEFDEALATQDSFGVQLAMALAHRYGLSRRWTSTLGKLLEADWHFSHEDIADALQDLREPATTESLYLAAQRRLPYLEYNDSESLARKCIWALHDIGTPDAIARLSLLAEKESEPRAGFARKRIAALAARQPNQPPDRYRVGRDGNVRPD